MFRDVAVWWFNFFLCVFCSHVMAKRSIFHFHYLDFLNCAAGRSRPGSELEWVTAEHFSDFPTICDFSSIRCCMRCCWWLRYVIFRFKKVRCLACYNDKSLANLGASLCVLCYAILICSFADSMEIINEQQATSWTIGICWFENGYTTHLCTHGCVVQPFWP